MKLAPALLLGLLAGCGQANGSSAQAPAPAAPRTPIRAPEVLVPADAPRLAFPVACKIGETCEIQNYVDRDPGPGAKDYRCGTQTYQDHGGVDIRLLDMAAQRAGVDVLAAAPGRVARLRDGVDDISVKAAGAPPVAGQECGNGVVIDHGGGWETQYCHLAKGSVRVKVGDQVDTGAPLARIGLSGNTEYPHLHLSVRKAGVLVDPFTPGAQPGTCDAAAAAGGLWRPEAGAAMDYRPGVVLNAGFSSAAVTMDGVEQRQISPASRTSPLIAYVRAINLQAGDKQELELRGPGGEVIARSQLPALDRAKAQYVSYAGKRAPAGGWPGGAYTATYKVLRNGAAAITHSFDATLQ